MPSVSGTTRSIITADLSGFWSTILGGSGTLGHTALSFTATTPTAPDQPGNNLSSGKHALPRISGPGDVSGTITGLFKRGGALSGSQGLVTLGGTVAPGAYSWSLTLNNPLLQDTPFASAGVSWHTYTPDAMVQATGSFVQSLSTDMVASNKLPILSGGSAQALILKMNDEDTNDNTFTFNALRTSQSENAADGQLVEVTTNFVSADAITVVGDANIFGLTPATGVELAPQTAGATLAWNYGGDDYSTSALWESIAITANARQGLISVGVNWRGTGEMTVENDA